MDRRCFAVAAIDRGGSVFGCTRRQVADDHISQCLPQGRDIVLTIQLLELPLRLTPESIGFFAQAPSFGGEFDKAASAVCRRRLVRDEAVAF